MRLRPTAAAATALVLLLTGCSLPLSHDVHTVGGVQAERRQDGDIQVQPPGPKPGHTPEEAVLGFLGAQADTTAGHAIARAFLTRKQAAAWEDQAGVEVYDPALLRVVEQPTSGDGATVVVRSSVLAEVRRDGSFVAAPRRVLQDSYSLERVRGEWRLSSVPAGLRLTDADRRRSLHAGDVYYLAPHAEESSPHLVPDHVFLPVGGDLATSLVSRLLRGPSLSLVGSAETAVPPGAKVRTVRTNGDGVVSVDLSGLPATMTTSARQALSAQLVWTLRGLGSGFSGLRLLSSGSAFRVPGAGAVQDAGVWDSFDADGPVQLPPYYFVSARRLRGSGTLKAGPATAGDAGVAGAVPVDEVAVTTDLTQLALLERGAGDVVTVRTGSLSDARLPARVASRDLRSPSWGSGAQGLWLLRGARSVVVLPPGSRSLLPVAVPGLPAGTLTALAVSRDGVRVALTVGGRLYVGRVEIRTGTPVVVGVSPVLPGLTKVSDVAWESSTSLVVIGALTRAGQVVRLPFDGSDPATLNTSGLQPDQVAASPSGLLLAADGVIYELARDLRRVQGCRTAPCRTSEAASSPVYPG